MAENSLFPGEPEAPKFNQTNPLQLAGQMQELGLRGAQMQKTQSEAQQQQLTLTAKQALGGIMQKHINPQTGEFDHVKAYGEMAAHPELGIIMPEVTETFLRMPGIKAEALSKEVDFHRNKYSLDSELFAEALRQAQAPGADMKSIATDLMIKRRNAGVVSPDESLAVLPQLVEMSKNPSNFQRSLMRASQFGQTAQKSLEDARLGLGHMSEEVEGFDQSPQSPTYGQKIKMPRYMAGGLTSGQSALYPNTAAGGVAPSSEAAVRQEGFPSTPPAARLAEPPLASKQFREYQEDTEGTKHWLRKEETSAQEEANNAIRIETNLHKQEELLKQFEQGPLMETRLKIAEYMRGLNFPEGTVKSFLGEAKGVKDSLGAAQLARKYFFEGAANELKTSMPGLQKATNFDVQAALKASPEMSMTKEGINQYMKNVQTIIDMAKERADFAGQYAGWSMENVAHKRAFNQSAYGKALRDWLTHKGLAKTGPLNVGGK